MACCRENQEPVNSKPLPVNAPPPPPPVNEIPNLAGELKIVHEDNSLTSVSLNAKDLWCLKALLTNAEKLGTEFANANGRALIMALKIRMFGVDEPVNEPKERGCGDDDDEGCCQH